MELSVELNGTELTVEKTQTELKIHRLDFVLLFLPKLFEYRPTHESEVDSVLSLFLFIYRILFCSIYVLFWGTWMCVNACNACCFCGMTHLNMVTPLQGA